MDNNSHNYEALLFKYEKFKHYRRGMAWIVGVITVLSVIVSLILPKYYRSTAILLPQMDQSQSSVFSNLAALAGAAVGQAPPELLYPSIIESEQVLGRVVQTRYYSSEYADSVNLIRYWKFNDESAAKNFKDAILQLQNDLDISVDKRTNIVTLSLLMRDPILAADVLNTVISELDQFMRNKRINSATEQRRWIETRLTENKTELALAENRLKEFREKNRIIESSPQLLLIESRLERDVMMNATIFTELTKQYEIARIEEVKNTPVINILDKALPATEKEKPKRKIIVLTGFFVSCVMALGYAYFSVTYGSNISSLAYQIKLRIKHPEPPVK